MLDPERPTDHQWAGSRQASGVGNQLWMVPSWASAARYDLAAEDLGRIECDLHLLIYATNGNRIALHQYPVKTPLGRESEQVTLADTSDVVDR